MKRHLNICIRIEETIGKIYQKLAESNLVSDQVRKVLSELAEEEDDHADQLRFALRFPEDTVVKSLPDMLAQAQRLLEHAEKILLKIGQNQADDQRAVAIGIELEKKFCQAHIAQSFQFTDKSLERMFAAMAKADENHCQRLLDLKKSLSQA